MAPALATSGSPASAAAAAAAAGVVKAAKAVKKPSRSNNASNNSKNAANDMDVDVDISSRPVVAKVEAEVVEPKHEPQPAATSSKKPTASKGKAKLPATAPAAAAVPVAATTDVETTEATTETTAEAPDVGSLLEQLVKGQDKLTTAVTKTLGYVARILTSITGEEVDATVGKSKKRSRRSSASDADGESKKRRSSEPGGFAKPTPISNALCDFLDEPHGTWLARTEVTKRLFAYMKVHNLQNPEKKREIIPDEKLRALFNVSDISFFNIQGLLKEHYLKPQPQPQTEAAAAAVVAPESV